MVEVDNEGVSVGVWTGAVVGAAVEVSTGAVVGASVGGVSVSVTGQIVVPMATVSVVITVEWPGQLVTVAAHDVTVRTVVV
jgi:hypothetical protein